MTLSCISTNIFSNSRVLLTFYSACYSCGLCKHYKRWNAELLWRCRWLSYYGSTLHFKRNCYIAPRSLLCIPMVSSMLQCLTFSFLMYSSNGSVKITSQTLRFAYGCTRRRGNGGNSGNDGNGGNRASHGNGRCWYCVSSASSFARFVPYSHSPRLLSVTVVIAFCAEYRKCLTLIPWSCVQLFTCVSGFLHRRNCGALLHPEGIHWSCLVANRGMFQTVSSQLCTNIAL